MLARRSLLIWGLILGAIVGLLGQGPAGAQSPTGTPLHLTLFRDPDSLTLLIPAGDVPGVTLAGLGFEINRDGVPLRYALEGFNFGLPLDALPAPFCLRLERSGTTGPLPLECEALRPQGRVNTRMLADANVFWHDGRQALPILIYASDALIGLFGTDVPAYGFDYTPPTVPVPAPSPTVTAAPTDTVAPPAEILFVLDASSLMSQPLGARTRWDAALDKLATLIARQNPLEEIGILVYGPSRSYFAPDVDLGTPTDPCDDYEWRLRYQHPLTVDLPSIGLHPAIAPGGAVALERALFAPDGADLRANPAVTTVIVLMGGLAPDDPTLGCGLTQRDLEEILYELSQDLRKGVVLELVGITDSALPIEDSYDNVRVWSVGSEAELSDTLDLILSDAAARDTQNPDVSVLLPLNAEQQANLRGTPTPVAPLRGTPLVAPPPQGPTPTAGPVRIEPSPTIAASPISATLPPPTPLPSPTSAAPAVTPSPVTAGSASTAPLDPACPAPLYGMVITDNQVSARVRTDTSTASPTLGALPYGSLITLCEERDGWYFIQSPDLPQGGWVYGGLLRTSTDATAIAITATAVMAITPTNTPRPTDTPAPPPPCNPRPQRRRRWRGRWRRASLSITGIDIGSGTGCSATIHVHVDGPSISGNIHVWNAYYDANGNVYPPETFASGDSNHSVTLGGLSEEHKVHEVWITSGVGTSNRLTGLVCNNWGQ